jgi:hypothetical protein
MTRPATEPTSVAILIADTGTKGSLDVPQGWGAVEVTFDFDSEVVIEANGIAVEERPHWDSWVDPPTFTVDGNQRPAGWSVWAYPLRAGRHTLQFRTPAWAERTVEVTAGKVTRVKYHATIVSRKDQASASPGGDVLETSATGKLRTLKPRPA